MSSRLPAGTRSSLQPGQVRVVALPPDGDGHAREAIVLLDADGTPRAYLNRCRHLPIPLDAGGRRFLTRDGTQLQCATHGARYRLSDGHCTAGPCSGARLQALSLESRGEQLMLLLI